MNVNDILVNSGISSAIVLIAAAIYKMCIHFRFRSSCCGKSSSMSVDLTPPRNESFILNTKSDSKV